MKNITEEQFVEIANQENCRADINERNLAISPTYVQYSCGAKDFLQKKVYPTWRTNKDATQVIGAFEIPRHQAFPISYIQLSIKPHLFSDLNFSPHINYFKTNTIIAFHCTTCGVYVIKDGSHRLLQCAVHGSDPVLDIYQVISGNWLSCNVDMKNFCECFAKS